MALSGETISVTGVRCERCVARLATALRHQPGLVEANANLVGDVRLTWDEDVTTRAAIVDALARAGFQERAG